MQKLIDKACSEDINKYKVAFFDIDGTILKSDGILSPKVIKSIKKLQEIGIKTCLATGRPYFGSQDIIKELGIKDAGMFSSGGCIVEPAAGKILLDIPIDKLRLIALFEEIKAQKIHTELYTFDKYYIEGENEISKMHLFYLKTDPTISDLLSIINEIDINKLVAVTDSPQQLAALREITDRYTDLSHAYSFGASHPHLTFLNTTSPKASRKTSFDFLIKHFNVRAEETISFGDADADAVFLSLAGAGIAMANATEKARQAAKYLTHSVEDDGVVYALQAMGLSIYT